jgi:hypothetical protein
MVLGMSVSKWLVSAVKNEVGNPIIPDTWGSHVSLPSCLVVYRELMSTSSPRPFPADSVDALYSPQFSEAPAIVGSYYRIVWKVWRVTMHLPGYVKAR